MFRMLIVDDEPEIVGWLYELFLLEMPELDVYKAFTAKGALDWLGKVKMDIVLTDIRMPGLSGLQLAERIKADWPHCKIIFLTGFDQFDYVYTAIKMEGVQYLLKNEEDESIVGAVRRAVEELKLDLSNAGLEERLKQLKRSVLPLLQREYILELLENQYRGNNFIHRLSELEMPFDSNYPVFVVIGGIKGYPDAAHTIRRLVDDALSVRYHAMHAAVDVHLTVWLVQVKARDDCPDHDRESAVLQGALERVQEECRRTTQESISFAVSDRPMDWNELSANYVKLKSRLFYCLSTGTDVILTDRRYPFADSLLRRGEMNSVLLMPLKRVHALKSALETGQRIFFEETWSELEQAFMSLDGKELGVCQEIYYSIAIVYLQFLNRQSLRNAPGNPDLSCLLQFHSHASWLQAFHYLRQVGDVLIRQQAEEGKHETTEIIDQLKHFISENLDKELSLVQLAEKAYFNPAYLSRLFKQITGENVSEHMLRERITKAKHLLETSDLKIHEIAERVGLRSSHYFARFFKKEVKLTPQEYRESFKRANLKG